MYIMKNKIIIYSLLMGVLLLLISCQKAQSPTENRTENTPSEEMIIDENEEVLPEASTTEWTTSGVKTEFPKDEDITKESVMPPVTKIPDTMKNFVITAKQWDFTPSEIFVNKWDTVRLEITSIDVEHGFNIPEYNINKKILPWEKAVVEFVADKVWTFSFFCNVMCGSGHRDMKWTLIVK